MLKKEEKLIITFHTTADAMAMEKMCRKKELPGRLIPVPREISAGCGLSWAAPPSEREVFETALEQAGIAYEQIQVLSI